MNFLRFVPAIASRSLVRTKTVAVFPRYFSTSISLPPDIEFEEFKQKLENDEVLSIDCRIPKELQKFGLIPKSVNMMVQTFGPDILLSDEEFEEKFGMKKPGLEDPIVIYCLAGIRARTVQLAMMAVGYKDARVYVGSYEDWLEKGGPIVYPEPPAEK